MSVENNKSNTKCCQYGTNNKITRGFNLLNEDKSQKCCHHWSRTYYKRHIIYIAYPYCLVLGDKIKCSTSDTKNKHSEFILP